MEDKIPMRVLSICFYGFLTFLVAGCGGNGTGAGGTVPPETYSFEREDVSTVSYIGQITRQVLISDVVDVMKSISAEVLAGTNLEKYDTSQEVFDILNALYELGGAADPSRELPSLVDEGDSMLQATYADLNDKNLKDKLAGNDTSTDHKDWSTAFIGWSTDSLVVDSEGTLGTPDTPEELAMALFWTFAGQAASAATGSPPIDAATPLYLTPAGHDLTQLVQKFLLGAVNFSQGTEDYLDDDLEDKGILAANEIAEDAAYTSLEHHWDEGFGYWGAARDYSAYTDDEIAASGGRPDFAFGYFDTNGDGQIDLKSEFNFSASVNAAKRDRGSDASAPTDFTGDADLAWRSGRAIIAEAFASGQEVDMAALMAQRDVIVSTWEKAIAATAIHYINDVLGDMEAAGTEDYSFADHAKHWSELKGFALSFQFNPRSPMSESAFAAVHDAIGDAPVGASPDSPNKDSDYRNALVGARQMIGDAYGFDEANVAGW